MRTKEFFDAQFGGRIHRTNPDKALSWRSSTASTSAQNLALEVQGRKIKRNQNNTSILEAGGRSRQFHCHALESLDCNSINFHLLISLNVNSSSITLKPTCKTVSPVS